MKNIQDLDLKNKRVLVRCDYNVPIENGIITDNTRITRSLNTINYLIDNNCTIIILSHFGRIKSEEDRKNNSLDIVAKELSKILNKDVMFVSECYGKEVKKIVLNAPEKSIIMLENTRIMDLSNNSESSNEPSLAKYWASLGDAFILDAFGSCHRAHASTLGITKYLPSAIGFLVQDELNHLNELINPKERPFSIIMGGAKIEDKLPIIKKLIPKCDYLMLGGGIATSFLKACGKNVGPSLATDNEELLKELKELYDNNKSKILLPIDNNCDNDAIMDIGKQTVEMYSDIIRKSGIIFINGTPGVFEDSRFDFGTKSLLEELKKSNVKVIVGGGDALNACKKFGYNNVFYFESTGGGATLEYLADETLASLNF